MCRLFGLHAGRAVVTATFWLLDAPDNLVAQSKRNPDGTGLGVFGGDGKPAVYKEPIAAWEDTEFACEAHEMRGTTFTAYVRYASTGDRTSATRTPSCRTAGSSRTTGSSRASTCLTRGWPNWPPPIWCRGRPTASGSSR